MTDKPKILTYSLIGFIGIIVLVQYEIREYLRFTPSNYWFLKFVLQYGIATILTAISAVGGIWFFIKNKTLLSSTPLIIVITGLICVLGIRKLTTNISYNNIVIKDGLYIDSATGKPLNGMYKSSQLDDFGNDEHSSKQQYKKEFQ